MPSDRLLTQKQTIISRIATIDIARKWTPEVPESRPSINPQIQVARLAKTKDKSLKNNNFYGNTNIKGGERPYVRLHNRLHKTITLLSLTCKNIAKTVVIKAMEVSISLDS